MRFSEKLMVLRRGRGMSQEQLADRLDVTRQSVSKWESDAAMPEIQKLIALSDLFQVSIDYLLKEQLMEPEPECGTETVDTETAARLERKLDELSRRDQVFRYTSRLNFCGLPLVSIRFGNARYPSRNNIALGLIAIGNYSIGLISIGLISLGIIPFGLIAFGGIALGLVSIGYFSVGVASLGIYAVGVSALGLRLAVGIAASGAVAVGQEAAGQHVLLWGNGLSRLEIETFIRTNCPRLWMPVINLIVFFSGL